MELDEDANICFICREQYFEDMEDWVKSSEFANAANFAILRNASCSVVGPCKSRTYRACTDDCKAFVRRYRN